MTPQKALLFLIMAGIAQSSKLTEIEEYRQNLQKTKESHEKRQNLYRSSISNPLQKTNILKIMGDQTGKQYHHNVQFAMNPAILREIEKFLKPGESHQMKSTNSKLDKMIKITGTVNLFPNESSIQVYRDMETKAITWSVLNEDEDLNENWAVEEYIQNEWISKRKQNIKDCFRHAENEKNWWITNKVVANCLFDAVTDECLFDLSYTTMQVVYPFFKEVLFALMHEVDEKRRRTGKNMLMEYAIRLNYPLDVAKLLEGKKEEILEEFIFLDNEKPIVFASRIGWQDENNGFEIMNVLLKAGADINGQSRDGNTALHRAGNEELVRFLVAKGADIEIKNENDETPLHCRARCEAEWLKIKAKW